VVELAKLLAPMTDHEWTGGIIALQPTEDSHREGLRLVCDPADPVWEIYPANWSGEGFDPSFAEMLTKHDRHCFTIFVDGKAVGTTSLLNLKLNQQALEIGGTYLMMSRRGTGLNSRVKRLLLDRIFGCGVRRIEFRVDERNKRSQAAVMKLGCTQEGILRAERITWTGHVRNTIVFSILADEWKTRA
jgi:RimJ/RimL family protein N-acetyltransferase